MKDPDHTPPPEMDRNSDTEAFSIWERDPFDKLGPSPHQNGYGHAGGMTEKMLKPLSENDGF